MLSELTRFQDAFAALLSGAQRADSSGEDCAEVAALAEQPGFAVYRNTAASACIETLLANYPTVAKLVGEEWMHAAAARYAVLYPPDDVRMLCYGADFADFLQPFLHEVGAAESLAYLPSVARLDRFWSEAHIAADQPTLAAAALAQLSPQALGEVVLLPHASARWAWFGGAPIYDIWQRNRSGTADCSGIDWHAQGALLVRVDEVVQSCALDRAACAFLDACRAERPLADCAATALAEDDNADLAQLLASLISIGVFARAQPYHEEKV